MRNCRISEFVCHFTSDYPLSLHLTKASSPSVLPVGCLVPLAHDQCDICVMLTLPAETKKALEAWIGVRGVATGRLFCSMNRAKPGEGRLTAIALYGMVRELGMKIGLRVWPHGLRHAAITEALDLTGGNVGAVQRFSRHRDVGILVMVPSGTIFKTSCKCATCRSTYVWPACNGGSAERI